MDNSSHNPLVSIIIPVYNVEGYIERCLDSIEKINYAPIEVIIINDASPDNCQQIIERYCKTHRDWIVIHKQINEGVTKARITGQERANGEYVMFIDSDDYVHPDILSRLVPVALESNADITCCGYYVDDGQSLVEDERNIDIYYDKASLDNLINERLLFDRRLNKAALSVYMWAKLFKNKRDELVETLKEGSFVIFEDLITMMSYYINHTESVECIKDPLYYYVRRPGQVTGKSLKEFSYGISWIR